MLVFRLFEIEWFNRRDWDIKVVLIENYRWAGSLLQIGYFKTWEGKVYRRIDFLWLGELTEILVDKWKGFS